MKFFYKPAKMTFEILKTILTHWSF